MAKTPNGLGQYSGKVGSVVYAVQNGQQIVRSYQPVVSNPKTLAQRKQRAKANLVGRISQITPWQILEGLGANRRERRSRFLRLGMQSAVVPEEPSNPNSITAKLLPANFVFSEGAIVPTMSIEGAVANIRSVDITLGRRDNLNNEEFLASGSLIVVTLLTTDGNYESVLYRFVDASEFGNASTLQVQLQHVNEGAYVAGIYFAPFKTTDGTSLRSRSGELFGENATFSAAMSYNPSALPLVWGRSVFDSEKTYTPTSASAPAMAERKK